MADLLSILFNMLRRIAPKKFLCRYPLSTGGLFAAIILLIVTFICGIALLAQVLLMNNCGSCSRYVWRNAYSFSVTGVIYCIIMLAMHGWLIWGVVRKKTSILLSWVVVTTMWLSQTFFLLIILICMHSTDVNFIAWTLAFIFGIIAICILLYLDLVVYGLWLELKMVSKNKTITFSNN